MIQSKKLKKKIYINHGFFNRRGGRSKGIYKSLNCGIGSLDTKINIKNNIKIVCKKIGADSKKIVLMKQIHSNKILFVDKNFRFKKRIIGDAIITNIKKIPIGVLTADCAPVLLYDEKQNLISAIHAGWKGAYKGIVPKVIKFFIKKKSKPKNIIAVIGPCIDSKNYEVKNDFFKKFIKKDKHFKKFFISRKNKTYFSLNSYIYSQLLKLGIKKIEIIKKNTFNTKNNLFSARRAAKNKENDYGRNISIIMIN